MFDELLNCLLLCRPPSISSSGPSRRAISTRSWTADPTMSSQAVQVGLFDQEAPSLPRSKIKPNNSTATLHSSWSRESLICCNLKHGSHLFPPRHNVWYGCCKKTILVCTGLTVAGHFAKAMSSFMTALVQRRQDEV